MSADPNQTDNAKKRLLQIEGRRRTLLIVAGPIFLLLIGLGAYLTSGRYVSTENAYIKADKIAVSAEVSGRVAKVGVKENSIVKSGDVLFRLDEEPFHIALSRAEARLAAVAQEIEALRATYREKEEALKQATDTVAFYEREHDRRLKLLKKKVISNAKFDEIQHELDTVRQQAAIIRQELARILASLGGDAEIALEEHPSYREALAARDVRSLDLARTAIISPAEGIVTKIELQPGEYVTAGTPVFSIVSNRYLWVEANLKETALTYIREGQKATIHVDTYPHHDFLATVVSISPATGAEFSLLPAQNATGNWVKIVQRIPVRLEFDAYSGTPPLRAGMSVSIEIDTGSYRALPRFIQTAFAWGSSDNR